MDLIDREQLMNYIRSKKINIGKLAHDIIMKQKSVNAVSEEVYTREYNLRKDAEMKVYKLEKALEQEPCEDTISRKAVLELIADYDLSMGQVVKGIHALPSVKPQEPILNKIRAEIMMKDGFEEALEIIDKYRGE